MGSARSAILTFHSLDNSGSVLSTPPARFRDQMRWLMDSGIRVAPLAEMPNISGTIALTFDDGFRNFHQHALAILEKYRLPATVFIVTGYCGRRNRWPGQNPASPELELMSWTELRELDAQGIELGAHTVNHPNLTRMTEKQVASELRDCKSAIEDQIGKLVRSFAYPYGAHNPAVRQLVRQQFEIACGTTLRFAGLESDPLDLPRIDAYYVRRMGRFETLMTRQGERYIAMRRLLRRIRACLSQ
jgi:peptidoglycan/xylan/chitin deacetylase (PgdA/CDA1 family)